MTSISSAETPEPKKRNRLWMILAVSAGVLVIACILCVVVTQFFPSSDTTPTTIAQATSADEELPLESTQVPIETDVPPSTLEPTSTPEPTNTPEPTSTPTEIPSPTPPPEPVYLSGAGDSVVDFDNPFPLAVVHIIGNQASMHFAVKNYDQSGNTIDLLVNTTDPYDGIRPLDFRSDEFTSRFEINATGDWQITVMSFTEARRLDVPGIIEGTGDDVFFLTGGNPDTANIQGNAVGQHFAVLGYGDEIDLLINTTDPYEGTVILDPGTIAIEVTGAGLWSIEIP